MIEVGKKYKEWTILRQVEERSKNGDILYECQCKCGKINLKPAYSLLSESRNFMCYTCANTARAIKIIETSGAYDDLINKWAGGWFVLKKVEVYRNEKGRLRSYFECICKCGFVSNIRADRLKEKNSVGCKNCSIANLVCKFCGCRSHSSIAANIETTECDLLGFCPRCDKFCCMNCSIDPSMECNKK